MLFKLIWSHIKIHKLLLVILITIPVVFVLFGFLQSLANGEPFSIGWFRKVDSITDPLYIGPTVLSRMLKDVFFGFIGLTYFLIMIIIMVYLILVYQINQGTISFWSTLPISRTKLILSKKIFLTLLVTTCWFPIFLFTTIFSSISIDASLHFKDIFIDTFQYLLFLILIENILFIIGLIFYKSNLTFFGIAILFVVYLLFTELIDMRYSSDADLSSSLFKDIIHYISLQNFVNRFAWFSQGINQNNIINLGGVDYYEANIHEQNYLKFSIMLVIEIIIIAVLMISNVILFKRKNLVI